MDLDSRDPDTVELVHFLGDEVATPHLVRRLLEDPDGNVRYAAACNLKWIGDDRALPALRWAYNKDTGVDFEGRRVGEAAVDAILEIYGRIYPISRDYSDEEIRDLIAGLESLDLGVVDAAGARLKSTDPVRVRKIIDELSADPAPGAKVTAADALTRIDPKQGFERLKFLLNDPDPYIRAAVIYLLGRIDAPAIASLLIPRFRFDPNSQVRRVAAEVLGTNGDATAIPVLRSVVEDKEALGDPEGPFALFTTQALHRLMERYYPEIGL